MKALRFHSFGAISSVLRIEEIPVSVTKDRELVVQIKASAINPRDVKNVAGGFCANDFAAYPGSRFFRHCREQG